MEGLTGAEGLAFECPPYVLEQVLKKRGRLRIFEEFAIDRTALIVIDMQRYYVGQMPEGKALVPSINRLASVVRSGGGLVAWVYMTVGDQGRSRWPLYHEFFHDEASGTRHRDGLTEGSDGHELWPDLDTDEGDLFVAKQRFSPFVARAAEIDLDAALRARGIENLLITGVATNFCCETTARDAMMLDYRVAMVADGCAARYPGDHLAGLQTVFQSFGDVVSTQQAIDELLVTTTRAR